MQVAIQLIHQLCANNMRYLLIIITALSVCSKGTAQTKCFQGDTLKYVIKCIEENRAQYIGKPFNVLLNDLELPVKSFFNGGISNREKKGETITIAFYEQTAAAVLADIRGNRRHHDVDSLVMLTIIWKTPLPLDSAENLQNSSGGIWTPAVQEYFGKQIIKDIIAKRFAISGSQAR
jgi:hypothetical protein